MLMKVDKFDNTAPGAPDCQKLEMRVLRQVTVADGGEYWLAELSEPLSLSDASLPAHISHVVVSPRFAGTTLRDAPYGGRPVNLAYLTNTNAVSAGEIKNTDVHLALIGSAAAIPTRRPEESAKRGILSWLGFGRKK